MKSKSILTAVIIIAIAVFVVAAVSTVITGPSDHYQRPEAGLEEQLAQSADAPQAEEDIAAEDSTMDSVSEQAADVGQAVEEDAEVAVDATTELVNNATEQAISSSKEATEIANKAVEDAQKLAAEGSEEAERLLEEVAAEAEMVVDDVTEEAAPVAAEPVTHTVKAQGLKYSPLVVNIAPGDTVAWTNMSTHNTESIEGLIPDGAEMWMSDLSANFTRTFTIEGIYVYKCTPHFGTGMGGAIIVGEPVNLEEIKAMDVSGAGGRLVRKAIQAAEEM